MIEFNINRILVPVDFSPASLNALDTAVVIAKRHDAAILLLNVVETGGLSAIQADNSEEAGIAMIHQSKQELLALQHSIIERFLVSCEVIVTTGIISAAIVKICASHQADMIVMGTHGSLGYRESFIGLNAFNVVKRADCPVLTIPPQKKWNSFKKILFPVRPIPSALEKYDFVRKIIRKNDATLKVLGLAEDYDKDVDFLKELASQLNERLRDDEVESSTYFKVGKNMAEEVLKIAALMEADLIVITATIDSSIEEVFVSPYTQHVINHSHFPVLSVKPSCTNVHAEQKRQYNQGSFTQEVPLYH